MSTAATIASRLLEADEPAPEQSAVPAARQVPHPSHTKWSGARKTFDDLWKLKQRAMDLMGEMGRSIRYSEALAELGYTREECEGPVPASDIASVDRMPINHPGRRWFRSYAQRFPDAIVGAKLKGGGILFFNNPHNPRTGGADYPTYEAWAAMQQKKHDFETSSPMGRID